MTEMRVDIEILLPCSGTFDNFITSSAGSSSVAPPKPSASSTAVPSISSMVSRSFKSQPQDVYASESNGISFQNNPLASTVIGLSAALLAMIVWTIYNTIIGRRQRSRSKIIAGNFKDTVGDMGFVSYN
ncbi:hypothetical protein BYT27DRAFT_6440521 [Phlegmacium glaucopus]|nr:hypothetical protein BYT27DRAFT_6440521 [Phlegmacium glaucopus]